jgi:hypothetical protein
MKKKSEAKLSEKASPHFNAENLFFITDAGAHTIK